MINKWCEGSVSNSKLLRFDLSKHSNEYFAHHTIPKHVDWASKRKIENMPPSNYEE